jgi:hypothetical protein
VRRRRRPSTAELTVYLERVHSRIELTQFLGGVYRDDPARDLRFNSSVRYADRNEPERFLKASTR